MRISDWSSDGCSSDLRLVGQHALELEFLKGAARNAAPPSSGPTSVIRSEARRVGTACVSTSISRWSPFPYTLYFLFSFFLFFFFFFFFLLFFFSFLFFFFFFFFSFFFFFFFFF